MARLALVAAALVLAGCLAPQPVHPGGDAGAWSTWGGPFVAHGSGYGYIAVDEQGFGPALPFTAVDAEGRVLWVLAAYSVRAPAGSDVQLPPALQGWHPIVAPLLADGVLFGMPGHSLVRVEQVKTATLPPADWEVARAVLEHGLATAREPRDADPNSQAVDGGTEVLVAGGRAVTLDPANDDGGGGWAEVREQMGLLRQWIGSGA
jgi:hypothetical protein